MRIITAPVRLLLATCTTAVLCLPDEPNQGTSGRRAAGRQQAGSGAAIHGGVLDLEGGAQLRKARLPGMERKGAVCFLLLLLLLLLLLVAALHPSLVLPLAQPQNGSSPSQSSNCLQLNCNLGGGMVEYFLWP